MSTYTFEMTCPAVPTQVQGRRASDDAPYYFRARSGRWELLVGEAGWPTELLDWPDDSDWDALVVASGLDETYGCIPEEGVRALLDAHLPPGEGDPHGYFTLAHWVALSGVAALSLVAGLLVGLIIGAHA